MIWDILVIICVLIIFLVIARRIPLARQFQKKEEPEVSPEEMTTMGLIANADDAFSKKDYIKAEELYVKAASCDPDNARIYTRLGVIYLEQENYYDAKEAFLQTVKLDESKTSHHINLGLAYMGLKDYYKAEQTFENALKLDPKNKKYQDLFEKAKAAQVKERKK
jgi:tetratricopeptide (TPR) repeat protein